MSDIASITLLSSLLPSRPDGFDYDRSQVKLTPEREAAMARRSKEYDKERIATCENLKENPDVWFRGFRLWLNSCNEVPAQTASAPTPVSPKPTAVEVRAEIAVEDEKPAVSRE